MDRLIEHKRARLHQEIRKADRQQLIALKRQLPAEEDSLDLTAACQLFLSAQDELADCLAQLKHAVSCNRHLSDQAKLNLLKDSGCLAKLVSLVSNYDLEEPAAQAAFRCLCQLSGLDAPACEALQEKHLVSKLIPWLKRRERACFQPVIFLVGNLSGESQTLRYKLIRAEVDSYVLQVNSSLNLRECETASSSQSLTVKGICLWVFNNFLQTYVKDIAFHRQKLLSFLPSVVACLGSIVPKIRVQALRSLYSLFSQTKLESIQAIVQMLEECDYQNLLKNCYSGDEAEVGKLARVLRSCPPMAIDTRFWLTAGPRVPQKDVIDVIYNNRQHLNFEYGLRAGPGAVVPDMWVAECFSGAGIETRIKLFRILEQSYHAGNWLYEELELSLNKDSKPDEIWAGLNCLRHLLRQSKEEPGRHSLVKACVVKFKVGARLEQLQEHPHQRIYSLAFAVLDQFFQCQ